MGTVAFTSLQKLLFRILFCEMSHNYPKRNSPKEVVLGKITENIENVENCDGLNVNHLVLTD